MIGLNLNFLITPASRAEDNWALSMARGLHEKWTPGTVIYCRNQGVASIFDLTVRYFNPQARWVLVDATSQNLERRLSSGGKGSRAFWVDTSTMEQGERDARLREWLESHRGEELRVRRGKYELWYREVRR